MTLFVFPYLDSLSLFVAAGVGYSVRRHFTKDMKMLFIYFLLSIMITFVQIYFALKSINNLWISYVSTPLTSSLLFLVLANWHTERWAKTVQLSFIPVLLVASILGILFLETLDEFSIFNVPFASLLLLVGSVYVLYSLSQRNLEGITGRPAFWCASGIVISSAGIVLIDIMSKRLLSQSIETVRIGFAAQSVSGILANILFSKGFLCLRSK